MSPDRPDRTTPLGETIEWEDPALDRDMRRCGLRPTVARRRVLALLRAVGSHPTVEELHRLLLAEGRPVQLPTLYQNLNRLADAGLILRFSDSEGLMRFDADVEPHHHLLCTECGRIADVRLPERGTRELRELTAEVAGGVAGWTVEAAQLGLRGRCPTCRAAC